MQGCLVCQVSGSGVEGWTEEISFLHESACAGFALALLAMNNEKRDNLIMKRPLEVWFTP